MLKTCSRRAKGGKVVDAVLKATLKCDLFVQGLLLKWQEKGAAYS